MIIESAVTNYGNSSFGCLLKQCKLACVIALSLFAHVFSVEPVQSSEKENEQIHTITDILEFWGIADLSDGGVVSFSYSLQRPSDLVGPFRFWGMEITNSIRTSAFLSDRALRCHVVTKLDDVYYVDCWASPETGEEKLLSGSTNGWVNLFNWLPEFELAAKTCNVNIGIKLKQKDGPTLYYSCRSVMDGDGNLHRNNLEPFKSLKESPPAPY